MFRSLSLLGLAALALAAVALTHGPRGVPAQRRRGRTRETANFLAAGTIPLSLAFHARFSLN
jgi:hypothetical protein